MPISRIIYRRQQRDATQLMNVALRKARGLAGKLLPRVLREYKTGVRFSISTYVLTELLPTLRTAQVAMHLAGYNRSLLTFKQAPGLQRKIEAEQQLVLGALEDALRAYENRVPLDIDQLQNKYNTNALRTVSGASDFIETEIRKTLQELIGNGAHNREAIETLRNKFASLGIAPTEDYRLEALFRTQTQLAYAAGKWQAEQDPAIQEILWGYKYVTIGDSRVRDEHIPLEGVTLPKDDPFWDRFTPPNGWNCRCSVIPIFDKREEVPPPVADENGGPITPALGFDFNPGKVFAVQRQLVLPGFDNLPRKGTKDVLPPPAPLPKPKVFAPEYNFAPLQVNKDVAISHIPIKELTALQAQPEFKAKPKEALVQYLEANSAQTKQRVATVQERMVAGYTRLEEKRQAVLEYAAKIDGYKVRQAELDAKFFDPNDNTDFEKLLAEHSQLTDRINQQNATIHKLLGPKETTAPDIKVNFQQDEAFKTELKSTHAFFDTVLGKQHAANPEWGYGQKLRVELNQVAGKSGETYRPYYEKGEGVYTDVGSKAKTLVHEIGHSLEELGEVHALAKGFLFHRVGTALPKTMFEVFGPGFAHNEYGNEDDFAKVFGDRPDSKYRGSYVGKYYKDNTEIMAMGVEQLYTDPAGFAKRDPEYFRFIVGVLTGELLGKQEAAK